ncbi:MAG: hypothetical protein R6W77_13965 [Trueperaceae bacterium]
MSHLTSVPRSAPFFSLTHRASARAALALALATLVASPALAQTHGGQEYPQTTFVAADYRYEGPKVLNPGLHSIVLENVGAEPHHVQFARLEDGMTPDAFFGALAEQGEAALRFVTLTGGVGMIPPGTSAETLVEFPSEGTYVLLCFVPNEEGVPHLALGMADVIEVSGEATAAEAPAADVEVRMSDFTYSMPDSVRAGVSTWKVVNDGPQPHEMIVLKLNDGVSFPELLAHLQENGEHGMPAVPIGGVQGLTAGHTGYWTYDLVPGEYAVVCVIPDPETGLPHLALGMIAPFTAEASAAN